MDWGPVIGWVLLPPPPPQASDSVACWCHKRPICLSPESIFHSYKISIFFPLANTHKVLFNSLWCWILLRPYSPKSLSVKINTHHPNMTAPFPTKSIMFARLFSLLLEIFSFPQYVTFGRPSWSQNILLKYKLARWPRASCFLPWASVSPSVKNVDNPSFRLTESLFGQLSAWSRLRLDWLWISWSIQDCYCFGIKGK